MKEIKQDVTKLTEGTIAHGVNCQRRMGSGIALAIRKQWPQVYQQYMDIPKEQQQQMLGKAQIIDISPHDNPCSLFVCNCFTQYNYGADGKRYADPYAVESAVRLAFFNAQQFETNLYMPKIGCGLGGLDWETDVKPIFQRLETLYEVEPYICEI